MNDTNLIDRRAMLAGATAAAACAALAQPARAAVPLPIASRVLATAEAGQWRAALGELFLADTEIGRVMLRLVSVAPLSADPGRPRGLARNEGFTAIFMAVGGRLPPGNVAYRLNSTRYAPMDVFFGPATDRLTAVFN